MEITDDVKNGTDLKDIYEIDDIVLRLITSRLQTVQTFGDTTELQENLPHLQAESLNL